MEPPDTTPDASTASSPRRRSRPAVGIILIAVGLLLLVEQFVPEFWGLLWPLLLMAVGLWLLWRARSS